MKKNKYILYKSAVGLASLIIFAVACSDDLTMGENLRQKILFSFDFAEKANVDAKTTTDIWSKTTFDKNDMNNVNYHLGISWKATLSTEPIGHQRGQMKTVHSGYISGAEILTPQQRR